MGHGWRRGGSRVLWAGKVHMERQTRALKLSLPTWGAAHGVAGVSGWAQGRREVKRHQKAGTEQRKWGGPGGRGRYMGSRASGCSQSLC